jgi:hypothetical protein
MTVAGDGPHFWQSISPSRARSLAYANHAERKISALQKTLLRMAYLREITSTQEENGVSDVVNADVYSSRISCVKSVLLL